MLGTFFLFIEMLGRFVTNFGYRKQFLLARITRFSEEMKRKIRGGGVQSDWVADTDNIA